MAENNEQVTLVFTRNFTPYNKGDVATFDKETAEALKNPTYIDEKGRERKLDDGSPVEAYSESKHKDVLVAMRGKDGDTPVEPQATRDGYYSSNELEAIVEARLEAERQRAALNGSPLSADETKAPVNRKQQKEGTVVTDPTGTTANGTDPQAVQSAQQDAAKKVKDNK